jgi:AcrR family transcriptional regulator
VGTVLLLRTWRQLGIKDRRVPDAERDRGRGGAMVRPHEAMSDLVGELLHGIAGRMEDVAQEAGVSYSALYSWATGRRSPGRANVERLAALAEQRASELETVAAALRARLAEDGARGKEG